MQDSILNLVEEYVTLILESKTPAHFTYHNLSHTKDVLKSVTVIGEGEKVSDEDLEILQISVWFHDIGYVERSAGHEEISAMYASNFLSGIKYPYEKIGIIISCILATKVPQKPKTLLEKIICDADLNHIGKKNFIDRNNMFRSEHEFHLGRKLTEYEWLTKSIDFLTRHRFFTSYAHQYFLEKKKENLQKLQHQLEEVLNR